MIELFKKQIWNDEKTVNVIAEGCHNENPKICVSACKFFLTIHQELYQDSDSDGEESEEERKGDKIALLK